MYPALGDLSPALTATVRQQARPFEAPVGAVVFEQDGQCSMFILLLGGEVDVSRPSASGREILLYRLRPGDTCVVGFIPLLTGLIGWCPIYSLFGFSTCPMKHA
jgi:CRP/FNR family transcriptional regulator